MGGLGSLSFEASIAHLFAVSVSLSENTMALRNYSVVSLKVTNDRRVHSSSMENSASPNTRPYIS